jgi:hypothetical protein
VPVVGVDSGWAVGLAVSQRRAQRVPVIALVVALHAVVGWMLLKPGSRLNTTPEVTSLSLVYLIPKQGNAEVIGIPPMSLLSHAPRPSLGEPLIIDLSGMAPNGESNAIHVPIDWANELNRAAEQFAADGTQPKLREFGAPHVAPTAAPKPPEFGWKRSRTNRLERVAEGTAVHLGDHCVITVTPLPVVSCAPGKKQANGDLFEHMRDVPQDGQGDKLP